MPFDDPEVPAVPANLVTTLERLSSSPCIEPPMSSATKKELNESVLLIFPAVSVTVIVQSE